MYELHVPSNPSVLEERETNKTTLNLNYSPFPCEVSHHTQEPITVQQHQFTLLKVYTNKVNINF